MTLPSIYIIDPAVHTPETSCFNRLCLTLKLPCQYFLPHFGDLTFTTAELPDAAIILGSEISVLNPPSWQILLEKWIKRLKHNNIPLLGFCYAHQLIAHMEGASIGELAQKKVGFFPVQLEDPLSQDFQNFQAFFSHREVVMQVPSSMKLLASDPEGNIQGLAHKDAPLWVFQPHLEASETFCLHRGKQANELILKDNARLIRLFFEFFLSKK